MPDARVVILTRAGCHLCQDAVKQASLLAGDTLATIDVDTDPELRAAYTDHVPVTFVDGQLIGVWFLDPLRLASALDSGGAR